MGRGCSGGARDEGDFEFIDGGRWLVDEQEGKATQVDGTSLRVEDIQQEKLRRRCRSQTPKQDLPAMERTIVAKARAGGTELGRARGFATSTLG